MEYRSSLSETGGGKGSGWKHALNINSDKHDQWINLFKVNIGVF